MKTIIRTLAAAILLAGCSAEEKTIDMRSGDLIFQISRPDDFSQAVAQSVRDTSDAVYNHVGIISIENGDTTVIEATFKGVIETPLGKFLGRSATIDGKPAAAIGRIKDSYGVDLAAAVAHARSRMGTPYDYAFAAGNDSLYCSELVQESMIASDGEPVFPYIPMSFSNAGGELLPYWVEHYARMGREVPEGEPGTNPAAMSRDEAVDIIFRYFDGI